jgi:hypothetical protein
MPIVTFWSNDKQTIGQTVSAATAATVMALEKNYKILLMSINFNDKTLEDCFGAQDSNREIIKSLISTPQMNLDSGINGILKLADSNRVTPELIQDYTKIIFNNRLEILYAPQNVQNSTQERATLLTKYKNIILNAARFYDYVIVDLQKGIESEAHLEILNSSDVIVMNEKQNIREITDTLNNEYVKKLAYKFVWNICKYDSKSKYNLKNLNRTVLKREKVHVTPYNTLLLEAAQEGGVPELLIRFRTLKTDSENTLLTTEIKELNEDIIQKYQELRAGIKQ